MGRSNIFAGSRLPLGSNAQFTAANTPTTGPFGFLNPTRHFLVHRPSRVRKEPESDGDEETMVPADDVQFRWTSRNNRKGRHELDYTPAKDPQHAKYLAPESTSSPHEIIKVIIRMFTYYPFWDISWLIAYIFSVGSIIWVINAFFVWLPLEKPSTEFPNEVYDGGGITAFIGATVFVIGSILLMLEAVNEHREGCFGWAIQQIVGGQWEVVPDKQSCQHHHQNRRNLVGKAKSPSINKDPEASAEPTNEDDNSIQHKSDVSPPASDQTQRSTWTWFPTWKDLRTHYIYELGFLACLAQLFGASVFWISGLTALPGVYNHLSDAGLKGAYYAPQIIGGSGFVVSGTLFMLETQQKWYIPAWTTLGWHIGIWNLIGGWGFTLCPIFGLLTTSWGPYQEGLATFWGSWAFLIGSLIQLYESLQKHPVRMNTSEG